MAIKYERQTRIPGWDQTKLSAASIAVVGAGALGNHVCLGLIGLGIGTIKIFDFDQIEPDNLNRQSLFCEADITKNKAETLAERLKERNSSLMIVGIEEKIDDDNIEDLFRRINLVIDCVDLISVRRILSRFCLEKNIPLIHGGISWLGGQTAILTRTTPCINCIYPESEQLQERNEITSCTRKPEASVVYTSQIIAGIMVENVRKILMPLPDDPPHTGQLLKYDTRQTPPMYIERIYRKLDCECTQILAKVAPEILKNEAKENKVIEKQKIQEISDFLQEGIENKEIKGGKKVGR
jgi:molybdopterin/thiamine biosynthesis adenylyltransferase